MVSGGIGSGRRRDNEGRGRGKYGKKKGRVV